MNNDGNELMKKVEEHREKLRVLKFDLAAGKVKNVKEIRKIKQTIAQMLTLAKIKEK